MRNRIHLHIVQILDGATLLLDVLEILQATTLKVLQQLGRENLDQIRTQALF